MIIIDASVIYEAFKNKELRTQILAKTAFIKAPPLLTKEILGLKGQIIHYSGRSSVEFNNFWKSFLGKIIFEEVKLEHLRSAKKLLAELDLDINDAEYIGLYLQNKSMKPVFWTYDTPFVIGASAQELRKQGIFANFQI